MEFKKQVTISEAAFIEYQIVAPDRAFLRKIITTLVIIVGGGVYIGIETNYLTGIYTVLGVSALYALLISFANKYLAKLLAKRSYHKHKIEEVRINFELKKDAIQLSVNDRVGTYKWEQITDIINTPVGFYFYGLNNSAIILDKKGLDDQEIAQIEDLIVKYKHPNTKLKLLTTKKN